MPAKTEKQRRFMGAELARVRAGVKTRTGMSEEKLSEYASVYKAVALIDAYLFKHGRILPCGHHAEEGGDIDKACTQNMCGAVGSSTGSTSSTPSGTGTNWGSASGGGSMGIHATNPNSTQYNYKGTGASSEAYWSGYGEG